MAGSYRVRLAHLGAKIGAKDCANFWRKSTFGQCANFLAQIIVITISATMSLMDFKTVSNQQARVATLFSQVLSVVANFTALDDIADSRTKCKFQQGRHWEKFISVTKIGLFFVSPMHVL